MDYFRMEMESGWFEIMSNYDIEWILDKSGARLAYHGMSSTLLKAVQGWELDEHTTLDDRRAFGDYDITIIGRACSVTTR